MITKIQLPPGCFLQLLQGLASPEKWHISVPSSVLEVKHISDEWVTVDGFEYLETTVEAPDDWDGILCSFTLLDSAGSEAPGA